MTHDENTLQAAIDTAFQTNGEDWQARAEKAEAELTQTQKHLIDANRGAQRNAHVNQSLAAQLNEALKRAEKVEAELANAKEIIAAMHRVKNSELSRLRPLAEAGPMPVGVKRIYAFFDAREWWMQHRKSQCTHFADILPPAEPVPASEAEPLAEPIPSWEPAVGDVVRLKSGGPHATVKNFTPNGLTDCSWFDAGGQYHQTKIPTACLEPVRKEASQEADPYAEQSEPEVCPICKGRCGIYDPEPDIFTPCAACGGTGEEWQWDCLNSNPEQPQH